MALAQDYLKRIPQYTRLGRHARAVIQHGTPRKWFNLALVETERRLRRIEVKGRPYILFLDPCNYCNLRCPLCPTGANELGRRQQLMSFECFKRYLDPHLPYLDHASSDPTDARRSEWERYRSEIGYTDAHVGTLLDALARSGHADDTVVVFFSDHGESFLEHPPINRHSFGLFEQELHVPLFLRAPGFTPRRVAASVRTVDLLPTLLELCGVADRAGEERVGQSLVPALRGEAHVEQPNLAEIRLKDGFHANALVLGREKLIEDVSQARFHLYDLGDDPGEKSDLAVGAAERVQALESALRQLVSEAATRGARYPKDAPVEQSPEELQRLRDLGYGGEDGPDK